jgi:hypothetical protein
MGCVVLSRARNEGLLGSTRDTIPPEFSAVIPLPEELADKGKSTSPGLEI